MAAMSKEDMKHKMEETWETFAAAYSEWVLDHHAVQGLYSTFEAHLVPALQGKAGARILDVASASGEPALTLAVALPQAQLVSTDLAHAFLELGKSRAARAGLTNVSFETADAEDLHRYGDASFDAVTCSLGLMFMPSFELAVKEFARVLKPGGLFAAAVWQSEDRAPFFLVTKKLGTEYDPELARTAASATATRFGDPAPVLAAAGDAGLEGMECRELPVAFTMKADEWWKELLEMPLPIKPALTKAQQARPDDDVFQEAHDKMAQEFRQRGWLTDTGDVLSPNNMAWFITARKPE
ncbi:methyltransferase type 11 [Chlorella sorokiniana]|uniref:Methyltransferase type 11 n=1 Tax=Chlorella sorokiniana TaxID=3076 RepID=A0A2P6TSJ3_CHLSO|nr:methyltransferase type 11 [Chlorella sorokiniana]|eukprot:PRW57037.1 methyltransferase type 11 [Chlorella sorokiniana]